MVRKIIACETINFIIMALIHPQNDSRSSLSDFSLLFCVSLDIVAFIS